MDWVTIGKDIGGALLVVSLNAAEEFVKEAVNGVKDASIKFHDNYEKRREVGFNVFKSFTGSFDETGEYCRAKFIGREPIVYTPAVVFGDPK